jgi:hypothetical protein
MVDLMILDFSALPGRPIQPDILLPYALGSFFLSVVANFLVDRADRADSQINPARIVQPRRNCNKAITFVL